MHNRDFKLQYSTQYLTLVGLFVLSSAVILLSLTLSWWLKLCLLLVLCAYGIYIVRYPMLCTLRYAQNKQWLLQTAETTHTATLSGDSTVTQWFAVLRFRVAGSRLPRTCLIFRDSLPQGDYRRLLVVLATV